MVAWNCWICPWHRGEVWHPRLQSSHPRGVAERAKHQTHTRQVAVALRRLWAAELLHGIWNPEHRGEEARHLIPVGVHLVTMTWVGKLRAGVLRERPTRTRTAGRRLSGILMRPRPTRMLQRTEVRPLNRQTISISLEAGRSGAVLLLDIPRRGVIIARHG